MQMGIPGDAPDVFILVDPELAMPDDVIPGDRNNILVIGTFTGRYPSIEAMIAERELIEKDLDARITAWQTTVRSEAWIIRWHSTPNQRLTIYGHLYTPRMAANDERIGGATEEEANRLIERITDADKRGWMWGKFFSPVEPRGEWGVVHRSSIGAQISKEKFESARARGWPEAIDPRARQS